MRKPGARTISLLAPLLALALWAGDAQAQAPPTVCGTPAPGQRIRCREANTSTTPIDLALEGVAIDTTGGIGIDLLHAGNADIGINLKPNRVGNGVFIATPGVINSNSHGLFVFHQGDGSINIVSDRNNITTTGGNGVWVEHQDIREELVPGVPTGDIVMSFMRSDIMTAGDSSSHGIRVTQNANGVLDIDFERGSISTTGAGFVNSSTGMFVSHGATGLLDVCIKDSTITTSMGYGNHGLFAFHQTSGSNGDIKIHVQDSSIQSLSTDRDPDYADTFSHGIFAPNDGEGDLDIDLQGGSIEAKGLYSYGVYGRLTKSDYGGRLSIKTRESHAITTTGEGGHGIVAYNFGTLDTSTIAVNIGGSVHTTGDGAQGVRVGTLSSGAPARVAAIDADGLYRQQTVTVNGAVTSAAEGVFLAGGGKVVIGPKGSIRSGTGIAIRATGNTPVAGGGDPIKPELRVDMNLGGRRVAEAIGDDWIVNDEGETTIAVNGVVLHERVMGVVPDAVAANGAWNVTMVAEGVSDWNSDPSMISAPALNVVAGRDFSAADFGEMEVCPPGQTGTPPHCATTPPPMCPEGQTGLPPHCATTPPPMCPEGQTGLPPHCATTPPPMCPEGQTGSPPHCATTPPPMCPEGQTGLPPHCATTPPPMCPEGQTGLPPHCATTPPPMCPEGQTGSPPHCATTPPPMCPEGQTGSPPNCRTPSPPPPPPPPPPTCPPGQTGTPPDCATPPPPMCPQGQTGTPPNCMDPPPEIIEEYAPRAAVYEALPGFLLRLDAPGFSEKRMTSPGSPVWARFSSGRGSYEAGRATVGAEYDSSRFAAEAGLDFSLGESATGSVSVRGVRGSAKVKSSVGGGRIEADGFGAAIGFSVGGASAYYAKGGFSITSYAADLSSNDLGRLKTGVEARASTLNVETGKRMAMSGNVSLAPRVWLTRTGVDVGDFTDAVDSRVSVGDAARFTGALGVVVETARARNWRGGALSFRGSLDLARTLGGADTSVDVSGERLVSESPETRLLFGLGGTYRKDRFSLNAKVAAGGLGSGDAQYAGQVTFGWSF